MLFVLLLTGCWDRTEVNDVAFVMSSAIDKEGKQYRTTIQIALPGQLGGNKGGGGGTSGEKGYFIDSKTGETLRQSNSLQQKGISRKLNFSHRRTLLIGEDFAREGIESIMDTLARVPQNRLTVLVIVTKGPAGKLLATNTTLEMFSAEAIRELAYRSMKSPRILKNTINTLLTEGIDVVLPVAEIIKANTTKGVKSEQTIRINGLAAFSKNKLAGFLNGDETTGVLLAMNEAVEPEISVEAPEGKGLITVKFPQYLSIVTPIFEEDQIRFRVKVRVRGTVLENASNYELANSEQIDALEEKLKEAIEQDINQGIRKLQAFHSDPIGFGLSLHQKNRSVWERVKGDWVNIFPTVAYEVHADVKVENAGGVIKPFGREEKDLE